jgi:uncharacterized 2Fe-2S/4Fe-4S cluster protein (DUF4445 family)
MTPVLLQVAGRQVEVAAGGRLSFALLRAGVMIETPCGSRGKCRKCRVQVTSGDWPITPAERDQLAADELAAGFRLSCQQVVRGPGSVVVVPELLVSSQKTGISRLGAAHAGAPDDPWYDRALVPAGGRPIGLALDIGTTTVVAALLRLDTGEELGGLSTPNPQGGFGADLMSRLSYAISGDEARTELQAVAVAAVNDLVARLCRRVRCGPEEIVAATVVGNTAMHHLFFGLPVEDLALAPYVPSVTDALERRAAEVGDGLAIHPRATVYALPNVAGFVGADAVAVMLACGLDLPSPEVRMAADIGTNGEIAVAGPSPAAGGRQRVVCCSAPAGPAFEGGEISQGMRAGPGAVEAVDVRFGPDGAPSDLAVGVIGGGEARGICGSGLLDAVAAAVRARLLDPGGRLAAGPALEHLAPALAARVVQGPNGRGIALGPGVVLTQKDVRALQLAKGAIRSGMELAMRAFGVGAAELDALWLAGAFGNYLHPEAALACGLVPPVARERLQPVGNAAAQGGKLALLSDGARRRAEALGRMAEHVELATHPDFEAIFFEALGFPEPPSGG